MGLIGLLFSPLKFPIWILETVRDEAERQYYDIETIEKEIREVEQRMADGELNQREGNEHLDHLIQRLLEAREYHAALTQQEERF
jgi:hypothetical protein